MYLVYVSNTTQIQSYISCIKNVFYVLVFLKRWEQVRLTETELWKGRKFLEPFLDLCVSSLREGHANLLCIVPILTDVAEATLCNLNF